MKINIYYILIIKKYYNIYMDNNLDTLNKLINELSEQEKKEVIITFINTLKQKEQEPEEEQKPTEEQEHTEEEEPEEEQNTYNFGGKRRRRKRSKKGKKGKKGKRTNKKRRTRKRNN